MTRYQLAKKRGGHFDFSSLTYHNVHSLSRKSGIYDKAFNDAITFGLNFKLSILGS